MAQKWTVNEQNRITVGNKVRKLREMMGLTQDALAEIMGYANGSMLTLVESGRRGMKYDKMKNLSEYVGIDPMYILDNNDYTMKELKLLTEFSKIVKSGDKHPLYAAFCEMLKVK